MSEVCQTCGLPKDLCVCEEINKEKQKIIIRTETKKFRKKMTIVDNLVDTDLDELATKLKRKLACGGTVKDQHIELQGDHKDKVKEVLISMGYSDDQIETL